MVGVITEFICIYWVGTERPDGSDMRMPVDRMPYGMIEHSINFFNADDIHQDRYMVNPLLLLPL